MLKIIKDIDKYLSIAMMVLMCVLIVLQVFYRYFLSNALDWPEELARYAFICSVFLGASYAAGGGHHLEISAIKSAVGKKTRVIINLFSTIATVIFCGIMVKWGIVLVYFVKDTNQISASLSFDMYLLYIVVPVSMFIMAIKAILYFIQHINSEDEEVEYR